MPAARPDAHSFSCKRGKSQQSSGSRVHQYSPLLLISIAELGCKEGVGGGLLRCSAEGRDRRLSEEVKEKMMHICIHAHSGSCFHTPDLQCLELGCCIMEHLEHS